MPVTERLIIPVQAGVDNWKDAVKVLLQTLKKQEGNIRTRWGPHSEDETKLEFLIGWESEDAQRAFAQSEDYKTVRSTLEPVQTGKPTAYFVKFEPYAPPEVIDAPFVEMLTFSSISSGVSEADIRNVVNAHKAHDGCTGATGGYSTSDVDGGKVFVGVIGWQSLDASQKAAASAGKVDAQTEIHHVNFRFPVKGFRGL